MMAQSAEMAGMARYLSLPPMGSTNSLKSGLRRATSLPRPPRQFRKFRPIALAYIPAYRVYSLHSHTWRDLFSTAFRKLWPMGQAISAPMELELLDLQRPH